MNADNRRTTQSCILAGILLLTGSLVAVSASAAEHSPARKPVSYSRDIRPLLANACYACHGPDGGKRQADLRLDVREVAVKAVIVPGSAAKSPLIDRVSSTDPDEMMPPPNSKRPRLAPQAISLLRQWIDDGAKFESHWAYAVPSRPGVPTEKQSPWVRNPIDCFIAAMHEEQGLRPSPDADPRTLLRRLSFDLVGLPPTLADVDAFTADHSPAAYERLVDRLLASPHYGERMAVYWLDVVRYADSGGYHSDNERSIWPYRDYVIAAFNSNKPFDRFTIEQLAGDLLPCAGQEQKIASGYNRLLQTTEEGGAQPKEYTTKYAADRVRNTATAWLGSTMGCAQCHNHKYDPFTSKDFYCFAAFFADVAEKAVARQEQTPLPNPQQAAQLHALNSEIAALQKVLDMSTPELSAAEAQWERQWKVPPCKAMPASAASRRSTTSRPAADTPCKCVPPKPKVPRSIAAILTIEPAKRSPQQKRELAAYYRSIAPQLADVRAKLTALKSQKDDLQSQIPSTLITIAGEPRVVRLLSRGNWQDDSGEIVTPAIPAFLGRLDTNGVRATRLDLARWMVARDNPLVARVFVNRLWRMFFGQGIVRTLDDCGTQGALPTHPELLDWLATEFVDSGWNVKHIVKLMLLSRTYQQSSRGRPDLDERDPANLWLARQGRFRFEAEMVRDNALAVSGLLSPQIGGPSVKPYQPAGYWDFLNFPKRTYVADHGEKQYRRGLYTFWQRTFLHPSLLAIDASTREECTVERPRSNTPLQALTMLNDPTYVEAAKALAARVLHEGGSTESQRIRYVFRQVLARAPTTAEFDVLAQFYRRQSRHYTADEASTGKLLEVGDTKPPAGVATVELAAWTTVARVILNLHETITRD